MQQKKPKTKGHTVYKVLTIVMYVFWGITALPACFFLMMGAIAQVQYLDPNPFSGILWGLFTNMLWIFPATLIGSIIASALFWGYKKMPWAFYSLLLPVVPFAVGVSSALYVLG